MKIGILGNGSIGSVAALNLAEDGHQVFLFGKKNREGSASKAAGAMLTSLAEIEDNQLDFQPLRKKFELSDISVTKYWPEILSKISKTDANKIKKKGLFVFTNNFSSPYELKDFNYLKSLKKKFKNRILLNKTISNSCPYELKGLKNSIYINDYYIDSGDFLKKLDNYLDTLNVNKIFEFNNYKIRVVEKKILLIAKSPIKKKEILLDYLVVALGAYSQKFFNENHFVFKNIQKVFFGSGFGFSFFPRDYSNIIKTDNNIYRTLNRGNACGFHLVPLNNNSFYFGASSTITDIEEFHPRLSSINVLSSEVEKQFDPKFSGYQTNINFGHRPVSTDTFPLLGPLKNNPNIIIATGNKREGFTQSPFIGYLIKDYISGNKYSFTNFGIFNPERKLISYFNRETAIHKTAEAKISGESMHDNKPDFSNWEKKVKERKKEYEKVYNKINLGKNFGIHPEILSLFFNKKI
jgi:glycine oxidase